MSELLLGLITGVIFGIFLQRGGVLRFEKQIGMLLLKDMTILKFMLSAIAVGMIGIGILSHYDMITLNHKPLELWGIIVGSAIFGIGWAITGLCPATSLGALGEGRLHAIFPIIGMLCGAYIYAVFYDLIKSHLLAVANYGKVSLSDVTHISSVVWIPIIVICILVLFYFFHKKKI